jgi:hypothetical protein
MTSKSEIKELIALRVGGSHVPRKPRIITDTSDFFSVDYDDVVLIGGDEGTPYLIRGNEREARFGIEEQPKFWVKRAIELRTGGLKILKLVFHERFSAQVGDIKFELIRSPAKEAAILELVRGHPNFMQGFSVRDSAGNNIRIIDYIHGRKLHETIPELGTTHEDYFYNCFPVVLDAYIGLVRAIRFLHLNMKKHGDIRRDHIVIDRQSGTWRWIDYDINYVHKENFFGYDLFGLGNILAYITGRGDVTAKELKKNNPRIFEQIIEDDLNIIFGYRIMNLKKVYPYLPRSLNSVLLHFSQGANAFYDTTEQLLEDLEEARSLLNG